MPRFKPQQVPDGHFPMGTAGVVVNLGAANQRCLSTEVVRQRRVWNHFLAMNIDQYTVTGEFVFYGAMALRLTAPRR